jgi:hypothetical protein
MAQVPGLTPAPAPAREDVRILVDRLATDVAELRERVALLEAQTPRDAP